MDHQLFGKIVGVGGDGFKNAVHGLAELLLHLFLLLHAVHQIPQGDVHLIPLRGDFKRLLQPEMSWIVAGHGAKGFLDVLHGGIRRDFQHPGVKIIGGGEDAVVDGLLKMVEGIVFQFTFAVLREGFGLG